MFPCGVSSNLLLLFLTSMLDRERMGTYVDVRYAGKISIFVEHMQPKASFSAFVEMIRTVLRNSSLLVNNVVSRSYSSQKMAFNVYGSAEEAPPLIVMHGLFGSKQNWRGIGKALEKKLISKRKVGFYY